VLARRAKAGGPRLGVFASSFNPVTSAHVALIEHAARSLSLNEVLALAGVSNADKTDYDCPLGARLEMLELAVASNDRVSIGISSTPFFVDMIEPIARACPTAGLPYFIVGFDTFVRIVDRESRYFGKYQTKFSDTTKAFEYLLSASRLIVASRGGKGEREIAELVAGTRCPVTDCIFFLDFPADLGERSATEVRQLARAGRPISGLVAPAVEAFIRANRLYSAH
jgi:nicotinic acid mononucleotide adenylyltransferase